MPSTLAADRPPPGEQTALLDLLERFDRAWQGRTPPRIDEFLPPTSSVTTAEDDSSRRLRLEELIKIDIEYRWRVASHDPAGPSTWESGKESPGPGSDPLPVRPLLEDYRAQYQALGPPDRWSPDLIGEEYRVRWRWGDHPGHAEYLARFAVQGSTLGTILAAIDVELASETAEVPPASTDDLATTPHDPNPPLGCRLCSAPIDRPPGARPEDLACTACGTRVVLDAPTTEPGHAESPPFPRVGRYEMGDLLGTGGFGSVWRARDLELGREVAIKLPRGGSLGSPDREERFLREARSAAKLQHRGIVAVHDTGRHQGTVYIVSELVHGKNLMQWLEQGPLEFREAAELAAQVADALDYAHQHGVVHRDLKPSNILLESDGSVGGAPVPSAFRPRILDFGLAKSDSAETTMTLDGQVLGTLAYMSPEQLRSPHGVDGRSDIYSLGVVLYQMLTHELPFRGVSRMLQLQVLEDEPSPPRRLNDRVPRDLETIAMKCLAKEPVRRYPSARDLADDLRRFLADEPIRARPIGQVERLRRWCLRKPAMASLAGGLALALLAGFAAVTWQWSRAEANLRDARWERDRAESNLDLARQVVNDMYVQIFNDLVVTGILPDYRRKILEKIVRFHETTLLPQSDDPSAHYQAGLTRKQVGRIQMTLSRLPEAVTAYRRALELLGPLADEHPAETRYAIELIDAYHQLALCYSAQGRPDEAEATQKEAVIRCERLVTSHPQEPDHWRGLANTYHNLARFYQETGRLAEAVAIYGKNVPILKRLVAEHPEDNGIRFEFAMCLNDLGAAYSGTGERAAEADNQAAELFEVITRGHPNETHQDRGRLAESHNRLGAIHYKYGRSSEAAEEFRRGAKHYDAILVTQPDNLGVRSALSVILFNLGTICHLANHRDEAEGPYDRARVLLDRLVADRPDVPGYRFYLAKTAINLGTLLSETSAQDQALPLLQEAEEALEKLIRDHPTLIEYREALPEALGLLGRLYRESGRTAEAMHAYQRAREILEALPNPNAEGLYTLAGLQAQCAALARSGERRRAGTDPVERPVSLDEAMKTLHRAIAAGLQGLDRLRQETNLDPLRSRADFQMLTMDLAFPADPFSQ